MTQFKYDIITLLELVEERPCLWDKSKNLNDKKRAWNDIFRILEERYDELSSKEKKEVGYKIKSKWVNIKDAFLKSRKTKSGQTPKKTYIYADNLKFLLKYYVKESSDPLSDTESYDDSSYEQDMTSEADDKTDITYIHEDINRSPTQSSTIKTENPETETRVFEDSKKDDDKFFLSFVPYLNDMTESEKMNLQMDILNSIKKIKQNRLQAQLSKNRNA